jgi:hypothetical protein
VSAGSIVVDLLMRTGSFETDTGRAAKSLAKFRKEAVQTAKEVGAVLGVAAVAAGTALVAMTKQAIDAADGLNKLSQKTGETAETLSGLQYAFELGDVSSEEFGSSMAKLARSMSEAAQGSGDTAAAFSALGVSVKNADGSLRGTGAVLSDVAEKFAGYEDGAEKTALAQAIFGKSGADLIPVLNAGADGLASMADEAKRLGIVIDTQTARAAEEFNDTMTKLGKATQSIGLRMATELLPTLQAIASEFLTARQEGGPFADLLDTVAASARTAFETLTVLGANIAFVFGGVGREIGAIAAQVVALATLDIKGFRAISDAVREDAQRARAELDAFERRIVGSGANRQMAAALGINDIERAAGPLSRAPRLPGSGGGKSRSSPRSPDTYADDVAQAVASAITGSDVIKAKELADQIAYLDELFFKAGLDAEIYESAMRKLTGQTGSAKDSTSEFLREQERLADLLGSTASAELERQRDDMKLLAKAYEDGRISVEKYVEAVQARLGQTGVQAEKTKSLAEDLGLTFTSAFEDAIVSGGKFSDVLKGLEQDLLRLITRKMITEPLGNFITDALKGAMGGSGGAGGGILSSIGSFFSSIFGGGRANGGPTNAGSLYQVNERGSPEMLEMDGKEFLLMGNRRGWVDPNPSTNRSSGTTWSPVFNMSFAAGTSVATATQAGAAVARRIQAAAQRNG